MEERLGQWLTALERGYLALAEGQTGPGEEALRAAAPGLPPVRATRVLRLLGALEEVSPPAARLLGIAAAHLLSRVSLRPIPSHPST